MAGYKVVRSDERKGKTHKVIGPDGSVKFFGDPNLKNKPNNPEAKSAWYARHSKSLAKNPHFRAYARATWAEGGMVEDYSEDETEYMAEGGKLKKGDPDTYITKDGEETRRGLWANVYLKKKRLGKLAEGGEVEEEEEQAPEEAPVEDMPRLQVPEIAPAPIQSGVSLSPGDMSLQKQERVKLGELPEVSAGNVATSKPVSSGGGGGGGILGKVLGFLVGGGGADGGMVPLHFADGDIISPEQMELRNRRSRIDTIEAQNISTPGLKTSSATKGGGGGGLRKMLGEASAVGAFANGGDVGGLAALTTAVRDMEGKSFPTIAGGDETRSTPSVPVVKPKAMADGGRIDALKAEIARLQGAEPGSVYDRSGTIAKLEDELRTLEAEAQAKEARAEAERAKTEAAALSTRQLQELDAADGRDEVMSDMAEAAARKSPLLKKQPPDFSGASGEERAANASLLGRSPALLSALDKAGVLAKAGVLTPETEARMKETIGAGLAADKKAKDDAAQGEADKATIAADAAARKEKEAADKLAADEKAATEKRTALAEAAKAVKSGKATPEQRQLLLQQLDELTNAARAEIEGGMKSAAPTTGTAAATTDTSGGAGDAVSDTLTAPTAGDIAERTIKGVGAIQEAPAVSPDLSPRLSIPDDLQTALSVEATRYTPKTFADLSKLTGRVGAVYSVAKRSGFDDATARKVAIDEGVKELQSPTLPALPSGEEAMAIARSQPEVAAMRAAAQRLAEIKLRDTELATQEAVATARLREAQSDLALAQANEFEVRRAAQVAQLDAMRQRVADDTLKLDKFLVDAKSRQTFGLFKTALAFLGTSMGGTINPYELARTKVQQELNTQLSVVDKERTLLGDLIQAGNGMDDAYKLADAQLKNLFALQLQKAAMPLRDERARLAGLEAANKLLYEAAKAQEEVVKKQVDAIYEPYKLKLQGAAGGVRDIFDYIKEGGDIEQLRQRLASDAADRAVRRSEVGVRKEEAQLKREDLQVKAAGNQLVGKLLAGQPLANAGEYASVLSSNPELRKALVKPFAVDMTTGKVSTQPGFVLARSEKAAEDLVELKGLSERSLDFLDRMESLLSKNGYNYMSMTRAEQGAFNTARDEFIAALGSKAARNVGVPSDKEYERLAASVPDASWYENKDRAAAKLKEFRRITAGVLQRAYDNNVYTSGQTGGATAPATQQATFKVRSKSNPSQVVEVDRQTALDMVKGPGGGDLEILP